jgi:hypothetical protein
MPCGFATSTDSQRLATVLLSPQHRPDPEDGFTKDANGQLARRSGHIHPSHIKINIRDYTAGTKCLAGIRGAAVRARLPRGSVLFAGATFSSRCGGGRSARPRNTVAGAGTKGRVGLCGGRAISSTRRRRRTIINSMLERRYDSGGGAGEAS